MPTKEPYMTTWAQKVWKLKAGKLYSALKHLKKFVKNMNDWPKKKKNEDSCNAPTPRDPLFVLLMPLKFSIHILMDMLNMSKLMICILSLAFLTLCFYVRQTGFPAIEVRGMTFSQSIEAPLTLKDTAIMSGQLSTRNGNGSGNINVTLHRNVSPQSWVNFDLGWGNGLTLGAKGYKNWTRRMFTNVAGVITFTRRGAVLGFTSSMPILLF